MVCLPVSVLDLQHFMHVYMCISILNAKLVIPVHQTWKKSPLIFLQEFYDKSRNNFFFESLFSVMSRKLCLKYHLHLELDGLDVTSGLIFFPPFFFFFLFRVPVPRYLYECMYVWEYIHTNMHIITWVYLSGEGQGDSG